MCIQRAQANNVSVREMEFNRVAMLGKLSFGSTFASVAVVAIGGGLFKHNAPSQISAQGRVAYIAFQVFVFFVNFLLVLETLYVSRKVIKKENQRRASHELDEVRLAQELSEFTATPSHSTQVRRSQPGPFLTPPPSPERPASRLATRTPSMSVEDYDETVRCGGTSVRSPIHFTPNGERPFTVISELGIITPPCSTPVQGGFDISRASTPTTPVQGGFDISRASTPTILEATV